MKNIGMKFLSSLVFASAALAASAENWYLKVGNTKEQTEPFTTQVSALWTNALGEAASAIASTDNAYVANGLTLGMYSSLTFPGSQFHLGAGDGASTGKINMRRTAFTVADLRWHAGTFSQGYGGACPGITGGTITLDCPDATHAITPNAATANSGMNFKSRFVCDLTTLDLTINAKSKNVIALSGDNCDFKGRIIHKGTTLLVLNNDNALGDPETVRADALNVTGASAVLAVVTGVTPNAARGLTIDATGFTVRSDDAVYLGGTATDCLEYELSMPISGTGGLTKTGDGTVTLSGAYTAGAITVSAGTLVLADSATFPQNQPITVKSGATLIVYQSLSGFAITQEEGATVERRMAQLVPVYDPDAKTVTTVVKTAFDIPAGQVQEVRLSNPIALPSHDALDLEVLRVAPGSDDLSASDFTDATEKTWGLPRTSFRVVKDEDGTQHLWLTVRPVVTSVASIGNVGINGTESSWSDAAKPHAGADYLLTNSVGSIKKYAFDGDNLTIANSVTLQFRYEDSSGIGRFETKSGNPVIIYPGVKTTQNYSGADLSVQGAIELPGAYGDEDCFDAYLKYGETASNRGTFTVAADLSGAGTLQIGGAKNGTSWNGLGGNNTNYFGRIVMTGNGTTVEDRGVQVRVSRPQSFGGRLAEFHEDAVTLTGYAMIKATGNVALTNDANRGLLVSGTGGFNCNSSKVFTCGWPVKLNGTMYKLGLGTLQLGGELTHGTSSTSNLIVRAGEVEALSDAAVAGLTLVATNDVTLAVPAGLSAGFAGLQLSGDVRPKVHVRFDSASAEGGSIITTAICTVPTASGITADDFVVEHVRGYACSLVATAQDGDQTQFSLACAKKGLILIMR